MKIKYILFVFLVICGVELQVQAMLKPACFSHLMSKQKHSTVIFATPHEGRAMRLMLKQQGFYKTFSSKNFIRDYELRDKESIRTIAMEFTQQLVTCRLFESPEIAVEDQIIPIDEGRDPDIVTKVYEIDGEHGKEVVGFHTYKIYNSKRWFEWLYNKVVSEPRGPDAQFHHLAVASKHQGKGFGKALFADALQDCQSKSVECITFTTTPSAPEKLFEFYKRFGFEYSEPAQGIGPRTVACYSKTWKKRLKPHPIIIFTHQVMRWIFKHK